jgi:maltose/moltooligosaccharide transporter
MVSALFLVGFARRIGAKRVHAIALGLAAGALIWLAQISNQYLALVPMIGLGIFWASAVGIPYLMVASMVPAKRTGVYMGILNMMIVIPMLLETVTFGWIFNHLLNNKGSNAITLAGALMAIGALAMLWVNPPPEDEESSIIPLGAPRHIQHVYDNVIVGTDGTPASLVTVGHAAGVAHAAEAHLVVVTAYDEEPKTEGASGRQLVHGLSAAEAALRASVDVVTEAGDHHIKSFDERAVAGRPAQALLDTAGNNPKNLIVVGNRGVDAEEGHMLGSVPAEVVRKAACNVLVVQTTRHPDDLEAITAHMERDQPQEVSPT